MSNVAAIAVLIIFQPELRVALSKLSLKGKRYKEITEFDKFLDQLATSVYRLADKKIGYRMAVVIGALLMTLGHAAMAVETPLFLYIGITLLIFGNGFFKPNMTSIISKMYEGHDEKIIAQWKENSLHLLL